MTDSPDILPPTTPSAATQPEVQRAEEARLVEKAREHRQEVLAFMRERADLCDLPLFAPLPAVGMDRDAAAELLMDAVYRTRGSGAQVKAKYTTLYTDAETGRPTPADVTVAYEPRDGAFIRKDALAAYLAALLTVRATAATLASMIGLALRAVLAPAKLKVSVKPSHANAYGEEGVYTFDAEAEQGTLSLVTETLRLYLALHVDGLIVDLCKKGGPTALELEQARDTAQTLVAQVQSESIGLAGNDGQLGLLAHAVACAAFVQDKLDDGIHVMGLHFKVRAEHWDAAKTDVQTLLRGVTITHQPTPGR